MKIEELMTQPVVTCSADDPMSCAAQRMWENDCGALPVVDADGHTVAVITDRDICMAAWTTGKALHELPVRAAMSHELHCCRPQDSAQLLLRSMSEHRVRRIPVVDDEGHAIGIVSVNDVTRGAARLRQSSAWSEVREAVAALAAICEPRTAAATTTATTTATAGPTPVPRSAARVEPADAAQETQRAHAHAAS